MGPFRHYLTPSPRGISFAGCFCLNSQVCLCPGDGSKKVSLSLSSPAPTSTCVPQPQTKPRAPLVSCEQKASRTEPLALALERAQSLVQTGGKRWSQEGLVEIYIVGSIWRRPLGPKMGHFLMTRIFLGLHSEPLTLWDLPYSCFLVAMPTIAVSLFLPVN